jgi:CheY-like chemotaxis protein
MNATPRSAVILIVEDDPNDVLFLQRALLKAGLRQSIRVARDGLEAVQYLSGEDPFGDREKFPLPCLVILDLKNAAKERARSPPVAPRARTSSRTCRW